MFRVTPESNRPLAGLSCIVIEIVREKFRVCNRPLAGLSCIEREYERGAKDASNRPLAGLSCIVLRRLRRGKLQA